MMNKKRFLVIVLLLCALTIFTCAKKEKEKPAAPAPAIKKPGEAVQVRPAISMPEPIADIDVLGYACGRNLTGLLDTIDFWVSQVNPQLPPGTAKMSVGQYFGDPTLTGIDATRSIVIVLLNPKKYTNFIVGYLPVTDATKIKAGVEAKGTLSVLKENILVVGDDNPCIMRGVDLLPKVQPFISKAPDADILVYANMESLMGIYAEDLKKKIQDLQAQMNMMQQGTTGKQEMTEKQKQTAAQVDEAIRVISEIKSLAIKADAKKEGLDIALSSEAKPQTELALLFNEKNISKPTLVQFLPEGGLKISVTGDYVSIGEFSNKIYESLMAKGAIVSQEQVQSMKKYTSLQKEALTGETAMSLFIPGGSGLNGIILQKVKNANKALELIRFAREKVLLGNNPAQGIIITADFKEKARQVDGVDVHTMMVSMSSTNPATMQGLSIFMPGGKINLEMAIVKDITIHAFGMPIDKTLQQVKSGTGSTTLIALSAFPGNSQVYGDLDFLKFLKTLLTPIFAMSQALGGGQNPLDNLDKISAPPITFYATMGGGRAMGKIHLGLDTVLKVQEAFKSIKPQGAAPQQPMPINK
jgi:hypothetical protein